MKNIIKLESADDFKMYNPVLVLNEDIYFDNRFCVVITDMGNIAFSYNELGVAPGVVIQNKILFLSFGTSYYVIDLSEKKLLYQSDSSSVIFEIIKCNSKSCVVFIGEIALLCFSLDGRLIWKNSYSYTIYDWVITEEGISVVFENGEKWLVSFDNGNGVAASSIHL